MGLQSYIWNSNMAYPRFQQKNTHVLIGDSNYIAQTKHMDVGPYPMPGECPANGQDFPSWNARLPIV